MIETRPKVPAVPPPAPSGLACAWHRLADSSARLPDRQLVLLVALPLFVLGAWPLLLVELPPFQDLPNHVATAHIIAHPDLYPEYVFNGFWKSNSLLTLWLFLAGSQHLFGAARLFTAVVLATTALALPMFVLRFAGRGRVWVASLFVWPLVHGFFVSMGMLNFAFAFAFSLILLTLLDGQRERPTLALGSGIAAVSLVLWYAHPFPLAVVVALVTLHVATRTTWPARIAAGIRLLSPLLPATALAFAAAAQHLVKADAVAAAAASAVVYLRPRQLIEHAWRDGSGAFTRWGSMTIVPALLMPYFVGRQWVAQARLRKGTAAPRQATPAGGSAEPSRAAIPFFSGPATALLAAAYVVLPFMLSNWWYLNCRLVPFLWAALAVRLPSKLPRAAQIVLVACAVSFSVVMAIDYVRLDRDRAEFTAGLAAVPERATLLPLLFAKSKTSNSTGSLAHAWAYYAIEKNTSMPLVFAVERSYPITYRAFPPPDLIPPALDRFAELQGTPARMCGLLRRPTDAGCAAEWNERWSAFWRQAEPRFSHVLAWSMPPEARALLPKRYRRVFAARELEIYARDPPPADSRQSRLGAGD